MKTVEQLRRPSQPCQRLCQRRRKIAKKSSGPRIFWRNGRANADFRTYADVGGSREALAEPGKKWGTSDPDIALMLFEARLGELSEKRKGNIGVAQRNTTTLAELVSHHLLMKAKAARHRLRDRSGAVCWSAAWVLLQLVRSR